MEGAVVTLLTALPGLIAGPASAVVICVLAMVGAGYIFIKVVIPEQRASLDKVLADSHENRKIFQQAVEAIDERFKSMERNVSSVKKDVDKIEKDISEIKMKI